MSRDEPRLGTPTNDGPAIRVGTHVCVPSASSKVLGDDVCTEEAFADYRAEAIAAGQLPFGTRHRRNRRLLFRRQVLPRLRAAPAACAELLDDSGDLRLAAAAKAIGLTCPRDASEARLVLRVRDYDRRPVDLTVADRDGLIGAVCETILGSERVLPTRGGLVATQRHALEWATDFVDNCLPAYGSRGCKKRLLGARWFQLVLVWDDETELPLCGATAGGKELAAQLGVQYPPQPPLAVEKRAFGYAQLTPPPAATSGSGSEVGRLFRASAETRMALESSDEGLACLAVLDVPACRRDALPLLRMHQTDASPA